MEKVKIHNCPVCASNKIVQKLTAIDYLVSGESFEIMECEDCTFRFTSPIPNEQEIQYYYQSEDYISHTGKGNSIINKIYGVIQFFTLQSKLKIVENYSQKTSGTILDIGCGTGKFLKTMQKSGWYVGGLEVNSYARNIAEESVGKTIYIKNDFFKSNQKFDVITLWHSLEHLHELKKYLNKISISINANGVLMIAVPNYKSYDAGYFKQDWAAYDVPRHLYHFSKDAISKLLNDVGFSLQGYQQLPLDPFYVSLLSETKVRKTHNIIKTLWIGWKSYLHGRKDAKYGSSVLYVFKRSLT